MGQPTAKSKPKSIRQRRKLRHIERHEQRSDRHSVRQLLDQGRSTITASEDTVTAHGVINIVIEEVNDARI
jgi:hypothetical protein